MTYKFRYNDLKCQGRGVISCCNFNQQMNTDGAKQ